MGVAFVDFDDFKQINDTLGHGAGDEALQLAARRLQSAVRESDTAGRHGGEEFLVLLPEVAHPSNVALIATKMLSCLAQPCRVAAVVLLKGSGSAIAAPAHLPCINATGNAALATPGTGDVLAGWIGGVWAAAAAGASTLDAPHATVASAWRHGAAADACAHAPLRAADLIEAMWRVEAEPT